MLQINLSRYSKQGETAEGQLYIEGCKICDTLEHTEACLPSGEYLVTLAYCKHFKRKMPLIGPTDLGKRGLRDCNHCCWDHPQFFLNNSRLPRFCPMIRPGNGVHNQQDGRLLVGERLVTGCITHPRASFDQLVNRIKEQCRQKMPVMLTIREVTVKI